jgi:hypothetical protein
MKTRKCLIDNDLASVERRAIGENRTHDRAVIAHIRAAGFLDFPRNGRASFALIAPEETSKTLPQTVTKAYSGFQHKNIACLLPHSSVAVSRGNIA